jgi:hypothetical protein
MEYFRDETSELKQCAPPLRISGYFWVSKLRCTTRMSARVHRDMQLNLLEDAMYENTLTLLHWGYSEGHADTTDKIDGVLYTCLHFH